MCFSGHGLLDLAADDKYFAGELTDVCMLDEEMQASQEVFADFPKPASLKSGE